MPRKARSRSLADEQAAPGGAAAVDRALSVLGAFRQDHAVLSLTDLARHTRLYPSTVLRLIASLLNAGLLRRQEDKYVLGPEVARLHATYIATFALEDIVVPVLRKLVALTGESAAFHVRQGDQRLCLYRVDSQHVLRDHTRAGDLLPLDRGAGVRVLMAFSGATDSTSAKIRREHVFLVMADRVPGVAGIAAPAFDAAGACIGSIALSMPVARLNRGYRKFVQAAAQSISSALGNRCAEKRMLPAAGQAKPRSAGNRRRSSERSG